MLVLVVSVESMYADLLASPSLQTSVLVHFVALHSCSHILWCRRRDLDILASGAIAVIALGIRMIAWPVGA